MLLLSNDMDGSGGVYTNTQQGLVIGDPTGGMAAEMTYAQPSGVVPTPADRRAPLRREGDSPLFSTASRVKLIRGLSGSTKANDRVRPRLR